MYIFKVLNPEEGAKKRHDPRDHDTELKYTAMKRCHVCVAHLKLDIVQDDK